MARVTSLLRYAWISNRRASGEGPGGAKAIQFALTLAFLFACGRDFEVAVVSRSSAPRESVVFTVLIACWLLLPLTVEVTIPAHRLAIYPLTRLQITKYFLISRWTDWRIVILFVGSTVELCASAILGVAFAVRTFCILVVSIAGGTTLACFWEAVQQHGRRSRKSTSTRTGWRPVLRKEVFYLAHTINPYFALAISTALGFSEIHDPWISPQKATALFVAVSVFHLNCVLNPFAIDSNSERERYLYLPLAFPEILHYKQTASAIMFAGSVSPLLLPLLWRLDLLGIVLVLLRLGLVTFNLLLTGIVLMRTDSAHSIRVLFWALRSNERILMLGFIAVFLDAAVPIVTMLITKDERPLLEVLSSVGILVLLIALLGTLCRRQTWASFRNTIAL